MGIEWADPAANITALCASCRHNRPGKRIPCALDEPSAYLGRGFAGCADHQSLSLVERQAEEVARQSWADEEPMNISPGWWVGAMFAGLMAWVMFGATAYYAARWMGWWR